MSVEVPLIGPDLLNYSKDDELQPSAKVSTVFSRAPSRPVRRVLSIAPRGSDGGFSIHPPTKTFHA